MTYVGNIKLSIGLSALSLKTTECKWMQVSPSLRSMARNCVDGVGRFRAERSSSHPELARSQGSCAPCASETPSAALQTATVTPAVAGWAVNTSGLSVCTTSALLGKEKGVSWRKDNIVHYEVFVRSAGPDFARLLDVFFFFCPSVPQM